MAADLYRDWLRIPPEKRPPNFFDLLGLSAGVEDAAAIEEAARRQVERVKQHLDGPLAAEGARLLKEIAAARAVLIDPSKRVQYVASLVSPGGGTVQPWWQDAGKRPAATSAVKAPPKPLPAQPIIKPSSSSFQGLEAVARRNHRKSSGSSVAVLAVLGGGVLVFIVAAIIAVVIFSSNQSSATPQSSGMKPQAITPTTHSNPTPATVAQRPKNNEPNRSMFLTQSDPADDDGGKPKEAMTYERHKGLVQSVSLSPHGRRFLSGGEGGVIEWDRPSGKSFLRHEFKVPATAVDYLPGTSCAACADEGSICIVDLPTNQVKTTLKNPRGLILAMAASRDGRHLLTGGNDGTLRWWDIGKPEPEKSMELGDALQIHSLAISRDGRFAAAGCNDGTIGIWALPAGNRVWQMKLHAGAVTSVAFSPDAKRLASTSVDKSVAVWNAESGKLATRFAGHEAAALCVAFLEKSPGLVSGGRDGALKFWSLDSGLSVRSISLPDSIQCLALAPADGYVVVGESKGTIQSLPMPALDFEVVMKQEPPAKKLLLPAGQELAEALKMLDSQYADEVSQAKPADLDALAQRLLAKAGGMAQPAQRLAFFRKARDLFAGLGKLEPTFGAIDECDRWFEIDDLAEKAKALPSIVSAATPVGQKPVIDAARALLRRAESEKRPDLAKALVAAMEKAAEKSGMAELTKLVAQVKKQRKREAAIQAKIVELQTKLKSSPNDRDAHLAYGLLLCSKNNWKDGLTHIAKGANAKLATIAKQDLAEPKEAKPRLKLAHAWADVADKEPEAKLIGLQRAKHWAELAEADLPAGEKAQATLLIGQISAQLSAITPVNSTPAAVSPGPKPKKTAETVMRRNYNTFRTEETFKAQWKVEGSSRLESLGLRLLDSPVSLQSTFQLLDNWKMEIDAVYDGREVVIEVNKQVITLRPTKNEPIIYLERKGKKLAYALAGKQTSGSTISLPDDARAPSTITIKLQGTSLPSRKEGFVIPRILVNGPVKLDE